MEGPEKPIITIKTNAVFFEIVSICWDKAGGTEDKDSVELSSSYKVLITEAIQESEATKKIYHEIYPGAVIIPSPDPESIREIWKRMNEFKLAGSKKKEGNWEFNLLNPHRDNIVWDCSRKAAYKWLRAKPESEVPAKSKSPKLPKSPELPKLPTEITKDELRKTQLRLQELRESMERLLQEEKDRVKTSLKVYAQTIEDLEATKKLHAETLSDLKAIEEVCTKSMANVDEFLSIWQRIQELENEKLILLETDFV